MRVPVGTPFCRWQWGVRPLLAYEAGPRASRLRALALFPRASVRRRALYAGIRFLAASGLDSRVARKCAAPDDLLSRKECASLLESLRRTGADPGEWLVAWPARPERRRIYLVCRDATTGRIAVVKIGAGDFNRVQLRNEAEILRRLAHHSHPFSIPIPLFEQELERERAVLALGGFPARLQPLPRRQAMRWSLRVIDHLRTLERTGPVAEPAPPGGHWAHGDLGPGNMLRDDAGGLFLFDWENAAADAPVGVDEVGFWLSLRQRPALRAPRQQANRLSGEFRHRPEIDIPAALRYLCDHDNLAAAKLLEVWA